MGDESGEEERETMQRQRRHNDKRQLQMTVREMVSDRCHDTGHGTNTLQRISCIMGKFHLTVFVMHKRSAD
jgi:hypothetical protein